MRPLKVVIAQVNVTVGDLKGNGKKIADSLNRARALKADLVVFPELALTGYPPEDLLFKPTFLHQTQRSLQSLVSLSRGITAIIGFPDQDSKGRVTNAAAILQKGRILNRYHKMKLPNYGVFDEKRYFLPGKRPLILSLGGSTGLKGGVSICEDIWVDGGPCEAEAKGGASLLINISASPYHVGKHYERERLLKRRARAYKAWILYVNLVGGQDELLFDGGSMLVNPKGKVVFRAPQFEEGLFLVEIPVGLTSKKQLTTSHKSATPLPREEEIFKALIMGTKDYCQKNGFRHVVIGLSGGIDSALTAAIAVAALGSENVRGVFMPSRYSSEETKKDARAVAQGLRIEFLELSIESCFQAALTTLRDVFRDLQPDVTEENLQARIRGMILMALSNKFGWLVLATGNKSELSTGYCTLYGDMVGGFAVIKDLPKTWVYRLAHTANRSFGKKVIPRSVFTRPPTAELRPNQKDEDTLPPYKRLDPIMRAYVEDDLPAGKIRRQLKIPRQMITHVLKMIDKAEYKRRQAPIGIKITPRAFGKDRRMPITNRFQES